MGGQPVAHYQRRVLASLLRCLPNWLSLGFSLRERSKQSNDAPPAFHRRIATHSPDYCLKREPELLFKLLRFIRMYSLICFGGGRYDAGQAARRVSSRRHKC